MKRITMTMLLLCVIGCAQIDPVRAEAPKPKGGCWSKDIAMRSSSDSPAMITVKGRIVAIERNDNKGQQLAAKELLTWVRLKTETGSYQSIYLGSDRYLKQQRLQPKVQDLVEIAGVSVIKPKQLPTIVASTIKKGNRTWKVEQIAAKPTAAAWCQHSG
jgi:hypothetical protein